MFRLDYPQKNQDRMYMDIRTENIDDFINDVSATRNLETDISYGNSELYSEGI